MAVCVQVRSLEAANKNLELQIREYYEKKGVCITRDYTGYFATIHDLEGQVRLMFHFTGAEQAVPVWGVWLWSCLTAEYQWISLDGSKKE